MSEYIVACDSEPLSEHSPARLIRAIIAAWWASLYSGHDVWIERDLPRAEFVPQTRSHGPAGDSAAARR